MGHPGPFSGASLEQTFEERENVQEEGWESLFASAEDNQQSPIDLDSSLASSPVSELEDLELEDLDVDQLISLFPVDDSLSKAFNAEEFLDQLENSTSEDTRNSHGEKVSDVEPSGCSSFACRHRSGSPGHVVQLDHGLYTLPNKRLADKDATSCRHTRHVRNIHASRASRKRRRKKQLEDEANLHRLRETNVHLRARVRMLEGVANALRAQIASHDLAAR